VDGVSLDRLGCGNELRARKIAFCCRRRANPKSAVSRYDMRGALVGVGVDGDTFDAQLAAGVCDSDGDLAAVGDQKAADHYLP
jgi:hypothetical protein